MNTRMKCLFLTMLYLMENCRFELLLRREWEHDTTAELGNNPAAAICLTHFTSTQLSCSLSIVSYF